VWTSLIERLPRWRYEARRAGWSAGIAPPAALLVALAMAGVATANGSAEPQVNQLLLAGLEALLPLALAMTAVTVVARDECRELQLSLPSRYASTLGRRLGVLAGIGVLVAGLFSVGLWLTGRWTGPSPLAAPLVWAPPALWLAGLAVLVGLLGRSVVVATTVVAVAWLGEQMFASLFTTRAWARPFYLFATSRLGVGDGWLTNRLALTASGLFFVAVVLLLLSRRPHSLLSEEEM
jgi:hypothetical protein